MLLKNLFVGQQWKNRQRIDFWTWGCGGEGEIYGKSNMETYITICKIDIQQEFVVWLRKLKQGIDLGLIQVGWGGRWDRGSKGEGIYVYLWLIHVEV